MNMTEEDFRNVEAQEIMAVVRDVMAQVGVRHELDEPPKPVPNGKLEFNKLSTLTRDRIEKGFVGVPMVRRLFKAYPDPLVPPDLAAAYRTRYQELELQGLAPGDIMDGLYEFTINGHAATTSREAAVWTVLAYFFEACTIFKEPPPITTQRVA